MTGTYMRAEHGHEAASGSGAVRVMAEIHYSLRDEIDAATAAQLRAALAELIREDGADLVIDCTLLNFIDSTGVAVLLEANQKLDTDGRHMSIVNVSGRPRRVLEALGLSDLLRLDHDGEATHWGPASTDADGG